MTGYDKDNPPEVTVGRYYAILGWMFCVAGVVMILLREFVIVAPWSWWSCSMVVLMFVMALIIIRPKFMDNHFKDILDALPRVKYQKPSDPE